MLAIHDQFTHQLRNRLKTAVMGLGLVRLLQDAGLTEEASTTLYSLENGFHGVPEESDKPNQKSSKANRLKGVSRGFSFLALRGYLGSLGFHKIHECEGVTTKPSARRPQSCGSPIDQT
jgi:hypothetical protein